MANLEQKNWQWIEVYPILNLCMLCTSQQQFWSELILVISHRTRAKSRVWFQTKLHSTQFNDNYLSLRLEWGLFKSLKKKGKKQAQWTNKVVEGSNVYDWPCFLFAKAMTVPTIDSKWLSGASTQGKNKQYYCCFLHLSFSFNYAIQSKSITWLMNFALNCTWKPILHASLRNMCDIGLRMQFNAEFTNQVMNFPL